MKTVPLNDDWETKRQALKNRKIVMAIDTSITGCSICIGDGQNFWQEKLETERGQAEFLVPMINDVVRKSGYAYNDIDRFIVTIGPGSFTGVRVGLSAAKALALSLNKPLFGFSTLEIIAKGAKLTERTVVLVDTKRGDFYGQVFGADGEKIDDAKIWTPSMIVQSGLVALENAIPDTQILAQVGLSISSSEINYSPERAPSPMYLRQAEVSQSKRIVPRIVSGAVG